MTTDKATTPPLTGAELDEIEAIALAAPQCWYGTYQIADGISDEKAVALIEACSPDTVLTLLAQARAQQAGAAPAELIGYMDRDQLEWLKARSLDSASAQVFKGRAAVNSVPVYLAAPSAVAPSDAKGKADAACESGLQKVVDEYALARWVQGGNWPEKWKNILAAIATTSAADAKDAALMQARDALNSLLWQFTGTPSTFRDSNARVQGHAAIKTIDAAIAAQQAQSSAKGGDAVGGV